MAGTVFLVADGAAPEAGEAGSVAGGIVPLVGRPVSIPPNLSAVPDIPAYKFDAVICQVCMYSSR